MRLPCPTLCTLGGLTLFLSLPDTASATKPQFTSLSVKLGENDVSCESTSACQIFIREDEYNTDISISWSTDHGSGTHRVLWGDAPCVKDSGRPVKDKRDPNTDVQTATSGNQLNRVFTVNGNLTDEEKTNLPSSFIVRVCFFADAKEGQDESHTHTGEEANASATVTITKDTEPPKQPVALQATPLNGAFQIAWQAPGDDDVASYEIYVDTESRKDVKCEKVENLDPYAFEPIKVEASVLKWEIRSLKAADGSNEQAIQNNPDHKYYIRVRAKDKAGNVGECSEETIGNAIPSAGPGDYFGEEGGVGCSSIPGSPGTGDLLWPAFLLPLALFSLFRRARAPLFVMLLLGLSASPAAAFSLKPTLFEIGGGLYKPSTDAPALARFYSTDIPVFRLTIGWYLHRTISIGVGPEFFSVGAQGCLEPYEPGLECPSGRSNDRFRLRTIPVPIFVRYGFEYWKDQWIVPFIEGGGDAYRVRGIRRRGGKPEDDFGYLTAGWHYGGGLHLLLDVVDTYHSNKLEDDWGIQDTFITVMGRRGQIDHFGKLDKDKDLVLSGWTYVATFTFRLK